MKLRQIASGLLDMGGVSASTIQTFNGNPFLMKASESQIRELPQLKMHERRTSHQPLSTRNIGMAKSLASSPSGRFLSNHKPKAIFSGDYELTAAIQDAANEQIVVKTPKGHLSPEFQRFM